MNGEKEMRNFDKNTLYTAAGISCIENYLLGFLKSAGEEAEYLYSGSLIKFEKLYKDFLITGNKYETYKGIQRLQDKAAGIGIISIEYSDRLKTSYLMEMLEGKNIDEILMIQVKPEFLQKRYNTILWRDDHYILLRSQGENIIFVNDRPIVEGQVDRDELKRIFTGSYVKFHRLRSLAQEDKKSLTLEFIERLENLKYIGNAVLITVSDETGLKRIRDFLGIYRIILKRAEYFSRKFFETEELKAVNEKLEKSYCLLEYMLKRKLADINAIYKISVQLIELYNETLNILKGEFSCMKLKIS
jgi:hypothetical protein